MRLPVTLSNEQLQLLNLKGRNQKLLNLLDYQHHLLQGLRYRYHHCEGRPPKNQDQRILHYYVNDHILHRHLRTSKFH
jgi:hypothetical protein